MEKLFKNVFMYQDILGAKFGCLTADISSPNWVTSLQLSMRFVAWLYAVAYVLIGKAKTA